ncbi:MAG: hypothetical protein FWC39_08565 [Bacteroidetes bacterium]|nr:hypothetical protein [Bacteroidota bacterium]
MKKYILVFIVSFSFLFAHAQNEDFYKHELKAAIGTPSLIYNQVVLERNVRFNNPSVSYLYRPVKWFWMGANVVNYFGNTLHYTWREYDTNGEYRDFSKSKRKYAFTFAPEIRFSYLNRTHSILYSSFSTGWCWENGYDNASQRYPLQRRHLHITWFAYSANFGKNSNIFLGGELGSGYKGFFNFHGGYRF